MEQNKSNKVSHKVGDTIEKVGQKISDAGANRVGNAIYNSGDKIEHSSDNKKPLSSDKNV